MTTPLLAELLPVLPLRLAEAMHPDRIATDRIALIMAASHADPDDEAAWKRHLDGQGD